MAATGWCATELPQSSALILGTRLFHVDSQEVINLVALAIRAGITASQLHECGVS